jgi:hypothetical protein
MSDSLHEDAAEDAVKDAAKDAAEDAAEDAAKDVPDTGGDAENVDTENVDTENVDTENVDAENVRLDIGGGPSAKKFTLGFPSPAAESSEKDPPLRARTFSLPPDDSPSRPLVADDDNTWRKLRGWYGTLKYICVVFEFFVQDLKETESSLGWWIIIISTLTSFVTLLTIDPFGIDDSHDTYYGWGKNLVISILTVVTTLLASWVKKKAYVQRIQDIDKRINKLERFLSKLDYQTRLALPQERSTEAQYAEFIKTNKDEYTELSIHSNLMSPGEFTYTVYLITRFHTPMVQNVWPWYDVLTGRPKKNFARNLLRTYESQYSWKAWLSTFLCCSWDHVDATNPLLLEDQMASLFWLDEEERFDYLRALPPIERAEVLSHLPPEGAATVDDNPWVKEQKRIMADRTATATVFATMTDEEIYAELSQDKTPAERLEFLSNLGDRQKTKALDVLSRMQIREQRMWKKREAEEEKNAESSCWK